MLTSRHKKPDPARAATLCEKLREFDLGLMHLVESCQDDMSRNAASELAKMHRRLRRMRYRIEAEAGI